MTPNVEKHLADQILRGRLVADQTHHKPKHPHVVTRIENLHCQSIAVRYPSNQHLV
jgi:hypothetical protein